MPELPEVETVRIALESKLKGRELVNLKKRRNNLRIPFPRNFETKLKGRTLIEVGRRGKYLLCYFSGGKLLLIHLGMSGQIVFSKPSQSTYGPHDHVIFLFDSLDKVIYRDPRRFGIMAITDESKLNSHPLLCRMGPEPFDNQLNWEFLAKIFAKRNSPIKNILMDQRVIAGLGNIYTCEALFFAGISPLVPASSLKKLRIKRLIDSIRKVLSAAIASGGSSFRDFVHTTGEVGYFQHQWKVYGKEGLPCGDCGPNNSCKVKKIKLSGRSTFWCSRKQR